MRAVALHADVIVLESRLWRTSATIVRSGEESFLIDSPLFPDELETLPALLEQAGFRFSGLLATHGDWDHLLGRLAFPGAALGVAETTGARLAAEPGAAQRSLREFDERFYISRAAPLALGAIEALPVPGYCGLGERELELSPADGHTVDGMAVWIEWAQVLVCGDYLSPVEIPTPEASLEGYLRTLARLEPLVERAVHVVAGHGGALAREEALAILTADRLYLEQLRSEADAALPRGRDDSEQRRLHRANVERLTQRQGAP